MHTEWQDAALAKHYNIASGWFHSENLQIERKTYQPLIVQDGDNPILRFLRYSKFIPINSMLLHTLCFAVFCRFFKMHVLLGVNGAAGQGLMLTV